MVNVFEVWTLPEMSFLEELADELEGTFLMIIGAGYAHDIEFIKQRQKEIREKYSSPLEHCITDIAVFHIDPAYEELQGILANHLSDPPPPEDIIERASNALYQHLILAIDKSDEEYRKHCDVFTPWN